MTLPNGLVVVSGTGAWKHTLASPWVRRNLHQAAQVRDRDGDYYPPLDELDRTFGKSGRCYCSVHSMTTQWPLANNPGGDVDSAVKSRPRVLRARRRQSYTKIL